MDMYSTCSNCKCIMKYQLHKLKVCKFVAKKKLFNKSEETHIHVGAIM